MNPDGIYFSVVQRKALALDDFRDVDEAARLLTFLDPQ